MMQQPTCASVARAALLHPILLLIIGLITWPAQWDCVRTVVGCMRSPDPSPTERDGHATESNSDDYYVKLIEGSGRSGTAGPVGWIKFREVIRFLDDDFLLFELRPKVRRTFFGQPFATNAYGMHDDPVAPEKPEATFRIAVLGASMDMGWGVRYQDTYIKRLQEWLNTRAGALAAGQPRRYEVLNFAVAAYSPLQRMEVLRRKVLAFHPDLVIYSATTNDIRLMEIHLCDMFRKRIDLKYDFVREAVDRGGIVSEDLRLNRDGELIHKQRVKEKLSPSYWRLYDRTLGMIASECRSWGVPLVMVIIPRVGSEDAPDLRAEPVARLKALATHHAITAFDLSDAFDHDDPATLEIASSDDHPNAMGHERLFEALSHAMTGDATFSTLLLPSAPSTEGAGGHKEVEHVGQAFQPDP
jgi:hypothetical protein